MLKIRYSVVTCCVTDCKGQIVFLDLSLQNTIEEIGDKLETVKHFIGMGSLDKKAPPSKLGKLRMYEAIMQQAQRTRNNND